MTPLKCRPAVFLDADLPGQAEQQIDQLTVVAFARCCRFSIQLLKPRGMALAAQVRKVPEPPAGSGQAFGWSGP
jgi:hypothetical protein